MDQRQLYEIIGRTYAMLCDSSNREAVLEKKLENSENLLQLALEENERLKGGMILHGKMERNNADISCEQEAI